MIRNTHRIGDYLMTDDESGLTHYASEMARDWDGQWRHKDNLDGRHPQLDVQKAVRRDPQALTDVRPRVAQNVVWQIVLEESVSGAAIQEYIVQEDSISRFELES